MLAGGSSFIIYSLLFFSLSLSIPIHSSLSFSPPLGYCVLRFLRVSCIFVFFFFFLLFFLLGEVQEG